MVITMKHVVRVYESIGGRVLPTVYKDKEFKTKLIAELTGNGG